jgi:catechol 2,3-dioxygenase-like lactoylglutathione lyase family enzyme
MSNNKQPTSLTPVLIATEAELYVSDFQRSCDYYVSKLGFVVEFTYGEPPFYGLVKRDRARLCLRLVCEPVFVGDVREREQLLSAAITVDTPVSIKKRFQ